MVHFLLRCEVLNSDRQPYLGAAKELLHVAQIAPPESDEGWGHNTMTALEAMTGGGGAVVPCCVASANHQSSKHLNGNVEICGGKAY